MELAWPRPGYRDLQVGYVSAERVLLAFLKFHEEDAIHGTLVILGVWFRAEVALPVLPLLLHLGLGKAMKARAQPFCFAIL
jgi:hypothetical protein